MIDRAARIRTGLAEQAASPRSVDTRIHADLSHLRSLRGRAKSLTFLPQQPARSVLNGRHASRLRGRGLNFEELRDYLPGDDVRTIDWKVTARTREPHVRVYTEERDRPALLVVDQRMSMFFGSKLNMKSVTAAEAAALAAFRILDQGDRVGGIIFGDQDLAEIRPARSPASVDRLINAIAAANQNLHAGAPTRDPIGLNQVLQAVGRIARRDHLILILSDGDGIDDRTKIHLGSLARHNDLIFGLVTDPIAENLPDDLSLIVSDGLLQAEINTASGEVRRALADMTSGRIAEILAWSQSLGFPVLPLSAGEKTLPQIRRLMGLGVPRR